MKSHRPMTLPESLTDFMLLANSDVCTTQQMSITSVTTSHSQNYLTKDSNEELLESVKYDQIVSILLKCDTGKTSSLDTLRVNSAALPRPKLSHNQRTP